MVDIIVWSIFLCIALFVLVRGADVFIKGAKQMGASLGMSSFAIGVVIVGFGTSLPELASSIAAVLHGTSEIVIANVVGSNITNIFLVVGLAATIGGRIIIERDLIKTELPIFFISTALLVYVLSDGVIDRTESLLLVGTFGSYLWYLFVEAEKIDDVKLSTSGRRPYLQVESLVFITLGLLAVLFGAKYAVDMVVNIAGALSVPIAFVSITAIALGTSLPELFVSLQAIRSKEGDLAIGNIFGSNAFNALVVTGIPGLIAPLSADTIVMGLGLGMLLVASSIFFVNGLARQVHRWEGYLFLLLFAFFVVKLVEYL